MAARGLTPLGDPRRRSGGGCSLACTVFPGASRAPIRRTGVAWRRRARKGTQEEGEEATEEEKKMAKAAEVGWSILQEAHYLQEMPQLLHMAEGIALDKKNGKKKCKGSRVVSKLAVLGGMGYRKIWRRADRKTRHYATGFEKNRRREGGDR